MSINLADFIDDYLYELGENTGIVEKGILVLKKSPDDAEELNRILRALHTIKGASRMLKFEVIENIAHGMENIYKGLREQRYTISKPFMKLTFIGTDYLRAGIEQIKKTGKDTLSVSGVLEAFTKACAGQPFSTDGLEPGSTPAAEPSQETSLKAAETQDVRAREQPAETGITHLQKEHIKSEYNTIRIKSDKVDKLIKSLNNLIIKQFQLKKENESITRLEESIQQLAGLIPQQPEGGGKARRQRDECLKLVQNLKKDFGEKVDLIEMNTFEVQEEIFSLRMLPLKLILDPVAKMAEETAMKLGKEVELVISGEDVMLDKIILEQIHNPVIHLIRNAIDHGIEPPHERKQAGKNSSGRLEIHCYPEGGNIMIKIKDDGRGIDYENVRKKAGIFAPHRREEIGRMNHEQLNSFLFMPGFSTKQKITALSGRGVGLDIVGYNVEKIKGKINLRSTQDQGTEFKLSLPLSLATVEGFFVSAAGESFLIPSNFTRELMIIRSGDIFDLLDKQAIKVRDTLVPVYYLSSVVKQEQQPIPAKLFVLIVESLGDTIGIIVDSVIQYASLIYKPLPKNMSGLKAIQGIVFNESFEIINILYIPELILRFKRKGHVGTIEKRAKNGDNSRQILIVDDSYSTREIEKSILETEQYLVTTAVDGVDGLKKLHQSPFDLIISDINMPRMDGMIFLEHIKRNPEFSEIPFIIVSSEKNDDTRRRFLEAGADSFIVKSEFERNNLINAVKKLIG